ncbi:MAG: SEC-C metal-binding domain-containing protein [Bryobacteraceae bacterium]|jgi:uncharacterized protein YchJ
MKREREELKKEEEEENSQPAAQKPENLHKNAQKQEPYRPCPCGSGKKHKFCCLNKPAGAAA